MSYLINEIEFQENTTTNHIEKSKDFILEGSRNCPSGNVLVLGGGKCTEIPILDLLKKHDNLEIIDINKNSISWINNAFKDCKDRVSCHCVDITGLTKNIRYLGRQILKPSNNPFGCADKFSDLISNTKPDFWEPLNGEKYSLVIASGIITQMQAHIRSCLQGEFLEKFPGDLDILISNKLWNEQCRKFAAQLELDFIDYLNNLVDNQGVIYLSDTMKVSWLRESDTEGAFLTDGYWLCTSEKRLTNFLSKENNIISHTSWPWLRLENEKKHVGRLYEVEAILYKYNEI